VVEDCKLIKNLEISLKDLSPIWLSFGKSVSDYWKVVKNHKALKRCSFTYGIVLSLGSGVLILSSLLKSFIGEIFRVISVTCDTASIEIIVNLYRGNIINLIIKALLF
jgi:hypothetical protein